MTKQLVVIIEDDPVQADIFSVALEGAGYETIIFPDGENILTRLADLNPSAIVLDMMLPKISGKEILNQLRAENRFAKIPIVLATAEFGEAEKSMQSKANLILLKPISLNVLRDAVASVIRK